MQLDFVQELTEARLYKNADTLAGKSIEELARSAYLMVLILELMRVDDTYNTWIRNYTRDTNNYGQFEKMRPGATDLHNLFAILATQSEYKDKITLNAGISLPILQSKRWLKTIENKDYNLRDSSEYVLKLESFLKIPNGRLKDFRRDVLSAVKGSKTDQRRIHTELRNYIDNLGIRTDLYMYFRNRT